MKTITLNIPDNMRIGEAIAKSLKQEWWDNESGWTEEEFIGKRIKNIEDQDLLSLLEKL